MDNYWANLATSKIQELEKRIAALEAERDSSIALQKMATAQFENALPQGRLALIKENAELADFAARLVRATYNDNHRTLCVCVNCEDRRTLLSNIPDAVALRLKEK